MCTFPLNRTGLVNNETVDSSIQVPKELRWQDLVCPCGLDDTLPAIRRPCSQHESRSRLYSCPESPGMTKPKSKFHSKNMGFVTRTNQQEPCAPSMGCPWRVTICSSRKLSILSADVKCISRDTALHSSTFFGTCTANLSQAGVWTGSFTVKFFCKHAIPITTTHIRANL